MPNEDLKSGSTYHARPGRPLKWRSPKTAVVDYSPNEKQKLFHSCPAEVVGYGGAAGGGKSVALLMEALAHCLETPGASALLMRRTYPELEAPGSLIPRSMELFPRQIAKYNEIKHRWTISTDGADSVIAFGHCRLEKDRFSYQSAEFSMLGFDEATHFTWAIVSYLFSRARSSSVSKRVRVRMTTNPGGVGHSWFKRYFGIALPNKVGYVPPGTVFVPDPSDEDPMPLSRCFIPARIQDNLALMRADPNYLKRLMLLPKVTRGRLLEGDWESPEGKYFEEFHEDKHVVKPFPIPRHWKVYRSVDYGFTKPFSCHWYAVEPSGRIYVIRELYQSGLRDIEQAQKIKALSSEPVEYTVGDPSMRNKNASGKSAAENYMLNGIGLIPADNNRIAGWMSVRNLLAPMADGKPGLLIFDTCLNLIREVNDAIRDEETPDDIDTDISDHAIDDLRYFASTRPEAPVEPSDDPYRHLNEASRREWTALDKKVRNLTSGGDRVIMGDMNRGDE